MSRRALGTAPWDWELRANASRPPSREANDSSLPSLHRPQANMSEEKHSLDRVPAWDGDKRQWKRYILVRSSGGRSGGGGVWARGPGHGALGDVHVIVCVCLFACLFACLLCVFFACYWVCFFACFVFCFCLCFYQCFDLCVFIRVFFYVFVVCVRGFLLCVCTRGCLLCVCFAVCVRTVFFAVCVCAGTSHESLDLGHGKCIRRRAVSRGKSCGRLELESSLNPKTSERSLFVWRNFTLVHNRGQGSEDPKSSQETRQIFDKQSTALTICRTEVPEQACSWTGERTHERLSEFVSLAHTRLGTSGDQRSGERRSQKVWSLSCRRCDSKKV